MRREFFNKNEVFELRVLPNPSHYNPHSTPYTVHPAPYNLHPTPYILILFGSLGVCGVGGVEFRGWCVSG